MKLKDILAKLAKGEALTDAEKAFLADFDPDQAMNDAAAAARRKAEEKLTAAEKRAQDAEARAKELADAADAKADEGKPELEKAQKTIDRLTAQLAERDALIKTLSTEKEGLTREQKLAAIIQKSGIDFIPGVDKAKQLKLLKMDFAELALKDLDDDALTKPILAGFAKANEAIIVDQSGSGSGRKPNVNETFKGAKITNPWKKESFNLTLQGRITKDEPELAARLKKEAGIATA
jgi:hypothetical protein